MSRKVVPKLKNVSGFLSKATFTYPNIADLAGRMLGTARPKEDPSVGEQNRSGSRARLTARSTYSPPLSLSQSSEKRRLPQHQPDPFALMVPLRTGNNAAWLAQREMLNGWRRQQLHLTKDSEQKKRITQRLSQLLGLDSVDAVGDFEDQKGRSSSANIQQNLPRRNLRLEEDRRQEAKRLPAKNLGPPVTLKPMGYPPKQEATPFRPCSVESATVLVASWCHHKSPGYPRPQEASRSTTSGNFKLNGELNRQQFQVYQPRNVQRSAYASSSLKTSQRPADHVTPQPKLSHPINVVRPDIPPLYTAPQVFEKVSRVVLAQNCQVELSEKEHESRPNDWAAWLKRRIHF